MRSLSILALAACLAAPAAAQSTDVLFLGNSYTNSNDLAGLVEGLATAGGHAMTQDRNTPGGNTLGGPQTSGSPHVSHPTSQAKLQAGGWDVVVLQEFSLTPAIKADRETYMYSALQTLKGQIEAANPGARVLLFQTWARRDPGQYCKATCATFATWEEMQDALSEGYWGGAALTGADVAPVGEAWRLWRLANPGAPLHTSDGSHPNAAGSYLAACVFYARLFCESPVGLAFHGGVSPAEALLLQQTAEQAAFRSYVTYCAAKVNSCGGAPAIRADGVPSASASSGFTVEGAGARFGSPGLLLYTDRGARATPAPFGQGGLLCLDSPLSRGVPVFAQGGTQGQCDATYTLDLCAFAAGQAGGNPRAWLRAPGTQVDCQWWGRDGVFHGAYLSDALRYTVCP